MIRGEIDDRSPASPAFAYPLAEPFEVLCPGAIGDIAKRTDTELVVEWNGDGSGVGVVAVRRLPPEDGVVATGPVSLVDTTVHHRLRNFAAPIF